MTFWPFKRRSKPPEEGVHTLADVARGMQHAVNTTQELLERHYGQMLSRYFNDDGSSITRKFILPDGSHMDVATIALVPACSLNLKEMVVRMSVRVDRTQVKVSDAEDPSDHLTRTSFHVSFSPRVDSRDRDVVDVTMKFVSGEPPEGVARIMEKFVNSVLAKRPSVDSS